MKILRLRKDEDLTPEELLAGVHADISEMMENETDVTVLANLKHASDFLESLRG